jgi:predicted dienelactone hydrolase
MKRILLAWAGLGLMALSLFSRPAGSSVLALPASQGTVSPAWTRGAFRVSQWAGEWRDDSRSRAIPVRIYYPDGRGPFPVILFSHGLGGSRDGYAYLGEYWASHGYVSVHIQHPGSDSSLFHSARPLRALIEAARDPKNAIDRPKDVSFALDVFGRLENQPGFVLQGKLDLGKIGVGGHSFGAYTALAASGRTLGNGRIGTLDLRDPRIKACVALSAPSKGETDCPSYASFAVPCLHMTGTKDMSPIGGTTPAQRRAPYDCIHGPDQYLVIFNGGDHMVFSGRLRRSPEPTDARFQRLVCEATTAFWDAYLKGDPAARAWLAGAGFKGELGASGTVEEKLGGR